MIHSVYKVTALDGRFYIGRHSHDALIDKYYIGTGKWPVLMRKAGRSQELIDSKQEVSAFQTDDEAREFEHLAISEAIDNPLCMNLSKASSGCRVGSGKGRKKTDEHRDNISFAKTGKRLNLSESARKARAHKGKSNPRAVKISFMGNTYETIVAASIATGVPRQSLVNWLRWPNKFYNRTTFLTITEPPVRIGE